MDFRRGRSREEPEINLIPMIDVLLVIIIFLMLTTTYAKCSGLEINLPTADAAKQNEQPNEVNVAVTATGQVEGGMIQALGYAVSEEMVYDERGRAELDPLLHRGLIVTNPVQAASSGGASPRRSTARIRATSSPGLNGFTT